MSNTVKGFIHVGGSGARVFPLAVSIRKQLILSNDKPVFYYSIFTLMCTEVTSITFTKTLGEESHFGELQYDSTSLRQYFVFRTQPSLEQLIQEKLFAESVMINNYTMLVSGDDIFYKNISTGSLKTSLSFNTETHDSVRHVPNSIKPFTKRSILKESYCDKVLYV